MGESVMTPNQLKEASTLELLRTFKSKARCLYSESKSVTIYNELEKRLGAVELYELRLATWHMQHGEGDGEFNEECDKLIDKNKKK